MSKRVRFISALALAIVLLGSVAGPALACGTGGGGECPPPEPPCVCPGTGTPGYWKNHPEAWPVGSLFIGTRWYTKAEILTILDRPDGDKWVTLFRALVAAKLNVAAGCDNSAVAGTISAASAWLGANPSPVKASSDDWRCGEPMYLRLDAYNNGLLNVEARD